MRIAYGLGANQRDLHAIQDVTDDDHDDDGDDDGEKKKKKRR